MKTMLTAVSLLIGLVASTNLSAQSAPIDNSKRPGAGAPNCAKLPETSDNCVFHTKKDQIDIVRLPIEAGTTWKATVSNPALAVVRDSRIETLPDGSQQQVFNVVPQTSDDADVVLKLERKSQASASAPPIETRSVNLMIHAIAAP